MAMAALRHMPMPSRGKPSGYKNMWPEFRRDKEEVWYAEWWGLLPGTRTRLTVTHDDIKAIDEVLPWLYQIQDPKIRHAVALRAIPLGWRKVGQELSKLGFRASHETARMWERYGIQLILAAF